MGNVKKYGAGWVVLLGTNNNKKSRPRPGTHRPPARAALSNGAVAYSPASAVPSARRGLTSLFGMGRGGSPALWPPCLMPRCRFLHLLFLLSFFFPFLTSPVPPPGPGRTLCPGRPRQRHDAHAAVLFQGQTRLVPTPHPPLPWKGGGGGDRHIAG